MVEVTLASKEAAARFNGYPNWQAVYRAPHDRARQDTIELAEAMDQRVTEALRSLADDPAMVERVARVVCPMAWHEDCNDAFWQDRRQAAHEKALAILRAIGGVDAD